MKIGTTVAAPGSVAALAGSLAEEELRHMAIVPKGSYDHKEQKVVAEVTVFINLLVVGK